MDIKIPHFSANKYFCKFCNVKCSKKNDWNRHILTQKHNRNNGNILEMPNSPKEFICDCGKKYITNGGLWKHMKKCNKLHEIKLLSQHLGNDITIDSNVSYLTNMVIEVVKNNSELQKHTNEIQKQNYEL